MADNKWTSRFFRDPGDEGVPPDQEAGGEDEAATEAVERGTAEVAREPETLERATADEPETLEPAPAGTEQLETLEQVPGEAPTEEVVAPPVEVEPHRVFAGTGISWAFIVGTLITVAIIVLAVQNTDRVPVTLYFWDLEAPLIIASCWSRRWRPSWWTN